MAKKKGRKNNKNGGNNKPEKSAPAQTANIEEEDKNHVTGPVEEEDVADSLQSEEMTTEDSQGEFKDHESEDDFHEALEPGEVIDEISRRNDKKDSVYVDDDTIDRSYVDADESITYNEQEPESQQDAGHESDFLSEHVLVTPCSPVPPRQNVSENNGDEEQYTVHKEERAEPIVTEEQQDDDDFETTENNNVQDEDISEGKPVPEFAVATKQEGYSGTTNVSSLQNSPEETTAVTAPVVENFEEPQQENSIKLEFEDNSNLDFNSGLQPAFDESDINMPNNNNDEPDSGSENVVVSPPPVEHEVDAEQQNQESAASSPAVVHQDDLPQPSNMNGRDVLESPHASSSSPKDTVLRGREISSPSLRSMSSVDSLESKKSASGTVSYESQFAGYGKDTRLVSRLVSNFESQIQDSSKPSSPSDGNRSRSFSRTRAKKIGLSLMNGVNNDTPPQSPPLASNSNNSEMDIINKRRSNSVQVSKSTGSIPGGEDDSRNPREQLKRENSTPNTPTTTSDENNMPKSQTVPTQLRDLATSPPTSTSGQRTFSGGTHIKKLSLAKSTDISDSTATNTTEEKTTSPIRGLTLANKHGKDASLDGQIEEPPKEINFAEDLKESMKEDSEHGGAENQQEERTEQEKSNINESSTEPKSKPEPTITLKPIEKNTDNIETDDDENLIFGVCVVGFHHHRGPEVEYWVGPEGDKSTYWPYLPFQSLPDGSHSHEENFCYFTLLYDKDSDVAPSPIPERDENGHIVKQNNMENVTTLFGIACNRQVKVSEIRNMTSDISRSTVQKSVVVVARKPIFGTIKEKLAVVTRAYFLQGDFEDRLIIDNLYENLVQIFSHKLDEADLNIGMPLRELIYRLGSSVLVILKALLLEKRVLFFSSNTELLCASQFSLVSLIPNLISHLEDCGSPLLSKYETNLKKPTSLKTSDRNSLLTFMGLPLQVFAAGGVFSPYVPLQQLDELSSDETKYFMIGSTNSLLLSPKQAIADVVVNMDDDSVQILNSNCKAPLTLSSADKKWMDTVGKAVSESWDKEDPWRPKGLGFTGSEDYIRVQFEDYIINLLASVKYDSYLIKRQNQPHMARPNINGNPIKLYNIDWVEEWKLSNNYRIFNKFTDEEIFDIVEPKHMASSPTNIDVQRQLIEPQAVEEERRARANSSNGYAGGLSKSVSRVFNSFWSEKPPTTNNTLSSTNGASSPTSQSSRSQVNSPKPSSGSTHTQGQESQDAVSLAESVNTAVTNASNDSTTMTGSENGKDDATSNNKESYFAGWSRWAAAKRRQLTSKSTSSVNSITSNESSETKKSAAADEEQKASA